MTFDDIKTDWGEGEGEAQTDPPAAFLGLKWTNLFYCRFLKYVHFFWMIMRMKKASNFQIGKV